MAMQVFDLFAEISLKSAGFESGLQSAQKKFQDFGKKVNSEMEKQAKSLAKGFAVATAGITAGLVAFGKIGLDYNRKIEDYTTSFTTLLGNASDALKEVNALRDIAASTPFGLSDLADATKTLLAFQVPANKVNNTLKMLGDVALGDKEKMKGLALVFGQVSSAGKLQGQDLMQLINQGFNPLNYIAKRTGESMAELRKRMSEGKVSADEVAQAFKDATSEGGQFYKGMESASKTTSGLVSTLKDNISMLSGSIFEAMSGSIKKAVSNLINLVGKIQGMVPKIAIVSTAIKAIVQYVAGAISKDIDDVKNKILELKDTNPFVGKIYSFTVQPFLELGEAWKAFLKDGDLSHLTDQAPNIIKIATSLFLISGTVSSLLTLIKTGLGTSEASGVGLAGVLGILSVGVALKQAQEEGSYEDFWDNFLDAVINGAAAVGLTGSLKNGALVFLVSFALGIGKEINDKLEELTGTDLHVKAQLDLVGETWEGIEEAFKGNFSNIWKTASNILQIGTQLFLVADGTKILLSSIKKGLGTAEGGIGTEGLLGVLSVGVALKQAQEEGSYGKFGADLLAAVLAGAGLTGLTGSVKNGMLAFDIVLNLHIGSWLGTMAEKSFNFFYDNLIKPFIIDPYTEAWNHGYTNPFNFGGNGTSLPPLPPGFASRADYDKFISASNQLDAAINGLGDTSQTVTNINDVIASLNNLTTVVNESSNAVSSMSDTLASLTDAALPTTIDNIEKSLKKIPKDIASFGQIVTASIFSNKEKIKKIAELDVGKQILEGLHIGLNEKDIESLGDDTAENLIKAFKGALHINSPSKVFKELGGFVVEGLAQGLNDAEQTGTDFANNFCEAFNNELGIHSPSESAIYSGNMFEKGFQDGMEGFKPFISDLVKWVNEEFAKIDATPPSVEEISGGYEGGTGGSGGEGGDDDKSGGKKPSSSPSENIANKISSAYSTWSGYASELMEAFDELYDTNLNNQINVLDEELEAFRSQTEERKQIFDEEQKKEIDSLREKFDEKLISQSEYEKEKEAIDKKYADYATNLESERKDKETEINKQKNEIARKQFEAKKATDIAGIWINLASSIMKAYADLGPIGGSVATGLLTTIAGVQTAAIHQQQYVSAYAKGGIITSPTIALMGEAGDEAVVPLENNTEWIDEVASRIKSKLGTNTTIIQNIQSVPLSADELEQTAMLYADKLAWA